MKRLLFWKRHAEEAADSDRPDGAAGEARGGLLTGDPVEDSKTISILLESIAEVSSQVGLDVVLESIVAKSLEVTQAERALLLLGDSIDRLEVRLGRDKAQGDLGGDVEFSRTVVGKCLEEGQPQRSVVNSDQEAFQLAQSVYKLKLRAVMCAPLEGQAGRLGVIYVDSTAVRREFSDRDLELFGALSAQLAVALESARLHADSIEKVRLEKDVELARSIQQHLLSPIPKDVPGLDLAVRFLAADEASGDNYDAIQLDDGRVVAMVGDVTGHGVGAALLTHAAQAALRSYLELIDDISEVARRLNERLVASVETGHFMSMVILVIDPKADTLHYINAGHPSILHVRGDAIEEYGKTGMVMGVVEGQDYPVSGPIALEPGDLFVVRTDGIDERMNPQREVFGTPRLLDILRSVGDCGADGVLAAIDDAVTRHAEGLPAGDDSTMLAVRVTKG